MSDKATDSTQLKSALERAKLKITKYDPSKQRSVMTSIGAMTLEKFSKVLLEKLGAKMVKFPEVIEAAHDLPKMDEILTAHTEETGAFAGPPGEAVIPTELSGYTLNVDITSDEKQFFLTTADEFISRRSGDNYIQTCKISDPFATARQVIPEYRPRHGKGVVSEKNPGTKEVHQIYNTYIPPAWKLWQRANPKAWRRLPDSAPPLLIKLLKHLLPDPEERRYFYAWLYASMTSRSYVYLVLCGAPGAGKNRLKLILRALHGMENMNDGKKSTLVERFNSQLSEGTLTWFDELKYNEDMENVMKEIQNDYISIERKGVDATRSSTIHSSMVISNNKPRDNFLAFDARKFAPLMVATKDLRHAMTDKEIDELTKKVEFGKPSYDPKFVAQIAKWILTIGGKYFAKYPNLEYRGPMFWTLAHTSMTRWQKRAVTSLVDPKTGTRLGWDDVEKAHLWSVIEAKLNKKHGESHNMTFPDPTSVRAFFEAFRDGQGKKAFETTLVPGKNLLGDFFIKPLLADLTIITEATIAQQRAKGRRVDGKKEGYNL